MGNNPSKLWRQQNTDQSILQGLFNEQTVQISPTEIVNASPPSHNLDGGIHLYNLQTTEYCLLAVIPKSWVLKDGAVIIKSIFHDKARHKLYLYLNSIQWINSQIANTDSIVPLNLSTIRFKEWVHVNSRYT